MISNRIARLRPVVIAGPTASGKSDLALRLAERDGGCVVNADALQVYACWRILTARPSDRDCARVEHGLYGYVACNRSHSVGDWLRDLDATLKDLRSRNVRPIIVGGSGLYLTSLVEGLAAIPPIPTRVRARSDALLRDGNIAALLADLKRADPQSYERIDRRNPLRVQRAWEVLTATGIGIVRWQEHRTTPLLHNDQCFRIVINPIISRINNNIDSRLKKMISQGALDECKDFLTNHPNRTLPAARALGASQLTAYLEGQMSLHSALNAAALATRQYAKRQRTWFRGHMADWTWLDPQTTEPLDAIPPL